MFAPNTLEADCGAELAEAALGNKLNFLRCGATLNTSSSLAESTRQGLLGALKDPSRIGALDP
jgi:hypothetical protein